MNTKIAIVKFKNGKYGIRYGEYDYRFLHINNMRWYERHECLDTSIKEYVETTNLDKLKSILCNLRMEEVRRNSIINDMGTIVL